MESRRFDELTRRLAAGVSRRTMLQGAAGGALAVALTALRGGTTSAADAGVANHTDGDCRVDGSNCRRDNQCCSRRCSQGHCVCRRLGQNCRANVECCSGECSPVTGQCIQT